MKISYTEFMLNFKKHKRTKDKIKIFGEETQLGTFYPAGLFVLEKGMEKTFQKEALVPDGEYFPCPIVFFEEKPKEICPVCRR